MINFRELGQSGRLRTSSKATNEIFQPAKVALDRITGIAKIKICSMRYRNAVFSKSFSYFIPSNHGFESLSETELTNAN